MIQEDFLFYFCEFYFDGFKYCCILDLLYFYIDMFSMLKCPSVNAPLITSMGRNPYLEWAHLRATLALERWLIWLTPDSLMRASPLRM